jgi:hypothetical protein
MSEGGREEGSIRERSVGVETNIQTDEAKRSR